MKFQNKAKLLQPVDCLEIDEAIDIVRHLKNSGIILDCSQTENIVKFQKVAKKN